MRWRICWCDTGLRTPRSPPCALRAVAPRPLAARDADPLGDIVSVEAAEHIYPCCHGALFMRDWRRQEKCCHDLDLYNGLIRAWPERVASFGGRKTFIPENGPRIYGVNDVDMFYKNRRAGTGRRKPSFPMVISSTTRSAVAQPLKPKAWPCRSRASIPLRQVCWICRWTSNSPSR